MSEERLVAYIHRRPGVPAATRALLQDFITAYAERQGMVLDSIFTGRPGPEEQFTVQDLIDHVRDCHASTVVIAGPAYAAIRAVRALPGVTTLTLEQARKQLSRQPR